MYRATFPSVLLKPALTLALAAAVLPAQSLDYQIYKAKVEPVFLKKREGHARCVVCHAEANNALKLQAWGPETKAWTEEQSRKNFEIVSKLVVPGKPEESKLLRHPLAHEAGGDEFHSGGRQFASKDQPEYKAIADWIRAAK